MPTIHLETADSTYQIHIGPDLLSSLPRRLRALGVAPLAKLFVVTSPEIWKLFSKIFLSAFPPSSQPDVLLLPPGEVHKRLSSVEVLAQKLALARADRDAVLLALGGGVVGDVTGFLAAIYMRGIRYVQLPTTLLAQVDSSIGGKTGVNLGSGKNLIGSFYQPLAVFADTATLDTLPSRELRAGMQEAIKAALIADAGLFRTLERSADTLLGPPTPEQAAVRVRVVAASARVKAAVVAEDEREAGRRMLLNLGHTLGHAIETASRYRVLLHGEAVGWGMIAAVYLARSRGVLSPATAERIERLILRYGPLPRFRATAEQLVALSARDKKRRGGVLSFVLPAAIGEVRIVRDVTEPELLAAAESMLSLMRSQPLSGTEPARRRVGP